MLSVAMTLHPLLRLRGGRRITVMAASDMTHTVKGWTQILMGKSRILNSRTVLGRTTAGSQPARVMLLSPNLPCVRSSCLPTSSGGIGGASSLRGDTEPRGWRSSSRIWARRGSGRAWRSCWKSAGGWALLASRCTPCPLVAAPWRRARKRRQWAWIPWPLPLAAWGCP